MPLTYSDLSSDQQVAADVVKGGGNVLITGPAGTGKSTLSDYLFEEHPELDRTATTGVAAIGVGGCTTASWAGLGLCLGEPHEVLREVEGKRRAVTRIREASMLAIDEMSMMDSRAFTCLDYVLRRVRTSPKPFGGLQMLFIGDFLQLPPVDPSGFAFQSEPWAEGNIRVIELLKIIRQKDSSFAHLLRKIRVGRCDPDVMEMLRSRIRAFDPNPHIKPVILATHNAIVDQINDKSLRALKTEKHCFVAHDAGSPYHVGRLDKDCLAPKNLHLRIGAQVMLLTNLDLDSGLANGSLGTVTSFSGDAAVVEFTNGMTRPVSRHTWEITEGKEVVAERQQLPFRVAYAITIHKSQGMTLEKVQLYLAKAFSPGQAYVALSRVKSLEGLFIETFSPSAIQVHPDALNFYRRARIARLAELPKLTLPQS